MATVSLLGQLLRNLRQQKRWTMAELASKAQIDKSVISRLEAGVSIAPHDATITSLATALGVPPERLKQAGHRTLTPLSFWERQVLSSDVSTDAGTVGDPQHSSEMTPNLIQSESWPQAEAGRSSLKYATTSEVKKKDSSGSLTNIVEYRITYNTRSVPGTAWCMFNYFTQKGLELRRAYLGSPELRAHPESNAVPANGVQDEDINPGHTEEFGRAMFKVSSASAFLEPASAKKEIEEILVRHYHDTHDVLLSPDELTEATVERLDATNLIRFSAQFLSLDQPGVVAEILNTIQRVEIINGIKLGLISLILVPVYERGTINGPVSLIDIRGFADRGHLEAILNDEGRLFVASKIMAALDADFRQTSQNHIAWSLATTNPRIEPMIYSKEVTARRGEEAAEGQPRWRVEYRAPNLPGTAYAVADHLKDNGFDIRRAFIGETNVAFQNADNKGFARARFNVFMVTTPGTTKKSETTREEMTQGILGTLRAHFSGSFPNIPTANLTNDITVNISSANDHEPIYFGLQIRLEMPASPNPIRTMFMERLTKLLFDKDNEARPKAIGTEVSIPRINIERLAFMPDYTGKLNPQFSKVGDELVDIHASIREPTLARDDQSDPRANNLAQSVQDWLCNEIPKIHTSVAYVGVRSITPDIKQIVEWRRDKTRFGQDEEGRWGYDVAPGA